VATYLTLLLTYDHTDNTVHLTSNLEKQMPYGTTQIVNRIARRSVYAIQKSLEATVQRQASEIAEHKTALVNLITAHEKCITKIARVYVTRAILRETAYLYRAGYRPSTKTRTLSYRASRGLV